MTAPNHPRERGGLRAAFSELLARPSAPAAPQEVWRPRVPDHDVQVTLTLKSSDPYLEFEAELRMIVTTNGQVPAVTDTASIGKVGIHRRAQQVAERYSLLDAEQLCAELNLALNQPAEINGTGVISRAVCASVAVDEQDTEALRRYRESQRTRHLVDLNAAIRREEIAYFDGLLTDPRQATAWWFHRNSSKVEQLPAVAETFTTLSGRLRPRESDRRTAGEVVVYQSEPDSRGAILEEFLSGTDEPTALILDRFVTRLFEQQQQTDLLDRWRDLSRPATETMAQAREAHDS